MDQAIAGMLFRRVLTIIGTTLAGAGLIRGGDAGMQSFIGAGMVIGEIAWDWYWKYGTVLVTRAVARMKGIPTNVGTVDTAKIVAAGPAAVKP